MKAAELEEPRLPERHKKTLKLYICTVIDLNTANN